MPSTLRDLAGAAAGYLRAGEWLKSLKVSLRILEYSPYDFENRMRVADLLSRLGERAAAREVYKVTAWGAIRSGYPLLAVVACKLADQHRPPATPEAPQPPIDPQVAELLVALAQLYGADSQRIGRGGARIAIEWEKEVPGVDPYEEVPLELLLPAVARLALDTSQITAYPAMLPRLPLLSDLSGDAFTRVLACLTLRRLSDGEHAVREGEPGTSFFLLARGRVRVYNIDTLGRTTDLATLGEPALFGEMALLSAAPRVASVVAEGDADLLECGAEALIHVAEELQSVALALDTFARERLVSNLLNVSPLFKPFARPQRLELMRRFTAHDVAPGTTIVRQGDEGRGLYLILKGEVDVVRDADGRRLTLATLKSGDIFGEISLLHDQPTTATVTAARPTTILFLAREYFQRLVAAVPQLAEYFQSLSEERLLDTRLALEASDEGIEELDVRVLL